MNKKAFTLLETVIAMTILSVLLLTVYRIQFGSIKRMQRWKLDIEKVFLVKNKLLQYYFNSPKDDKPIVDEQPGFRSTISLRHIPKKSELKDFQDSVHILVSEGKWEDGYMDMLTLVPVKEKSDEKK